MRDWFGEEVQPSPQAASRMEERYLCPCPLLVSCSSLRLAVPSVVDLESQAEATEALTWKGAK